ncbi:MAG: sulfotransferase [Gammaproteobacteria bacterium]|nr:sulfotransferase [Gammaproteobacteria bacterium]
MKDLVKELSKFEADGETFPAIDVLEQLVEAEPDNLDYRFRLGVNCVNVGQVERAESLFRSCIDAGMDDSGVQLNLGHALKALGKTEEAVECYKALADSEDDSTASIGYWSLANMKTYRFDDRVLTRLRDRAQSSDMGSPFRGLMFFALTAAWEQKHRYENAFMAMSEANLIFAAQQPFRGDLYGQMIKSMLDQVKTPSTLPAIAGPTPIFIVGMPRSGTTLVEQILASHSSVEATDELPFLNRIGLELEMGGGYARALADLDASRQETHAKQYMAKTEPYRKLDRPFFIDKNPANFLHVGLIKTLFPNAKIINVIRDPLDNAIGLFKMYFNKGAEYSFSMEGIIYYWQGYLTLMRHWDQLYPGEVMHLSYEDLARKPKKKITEILEYCGLPIEEQCFRFYESDRPVLTPSAGQVRNPISTKSIGSGQNYEQYIKTSIPALAEIKRKSREVFGI